MTDKQTMSSLATKLQQFAAGLTPEEESRLRALQTADDLVALVPALRAKLERSAAELTLEEQAELRLLPAGADGRAVLGGQADVEGHMAPLYDDGLGNKGRPQPTEGTGGGGDLGALIPKQYKDAWNFIRGLRTHNIIPTSITWPPY
jgi:hypothetical protein